MTVAAVVRLDLFRKACRVAEFLRGTYHDPPWLGGVRVEVAKDGTMRLVVLLNWETVLIRRCVPTSVSGIPVVVRLERGAGGVPDSR